MEQFPQRIKDPASTLDYPVDWSQWLASSGDTISQVSWVLSSSDLTVVNSSNTTTMATVWLSGGILNKIYRVTCRITTTAGRIEDFSFELNIQDK